MVRLSLALFLWQPTHIYLVLLTDFCTVTSFPHQFISNLMPNTKSYSFLTPTPSVGVIMKESFILAAELIYLFLSILQ